MNTAFHAASDDDPARDRDLPLGAFDTELAMALDELGRRVQPHEFDPAAIQRRNARRRSYRMATASAAALAVAAAGVTAFATGAGGTPALDGTQKAAGCTAAGTDPLTVPGVFRRTPAATEPTGFSQFGATTFTAIDRVDGAGTMRVAQTAWSVGGVAYTAEVTWPGQPETTPPSGNDATVVGTVNGHPAYLSNMPQRQLTFWTGSQGYALLIIFKHGETDSSATASALLNTAENLETTQVAVPLPVCVHGLDTATVTAAGMGSSVPDQKYPWNAYLTLEIDGRSYTIDAIPGVAVTPTPTGGRDTTGVVAATETINGLGITVTTTAGTQGTAQAPTAAQILNHLTSLGTDPQDWTTNVLVK